MSRLNAFFQLVDDVEVPHWKNQSHTDRVQKKNVKDKLDPMEKQRLSVLEQKFSGFLQFDKIKKQNKYQDDDDDDDDDASSMNSSQCDYMNEDEYNAFNITDDLNTYFNSIGIEAISKALSKKKKSNFEIKLLTHALMNNPFFKKMRRQITETLYQDLFQEIQLETYNTLDTVFQFGDQGDKFFIILSGDIGIALQQVEREREQQALQKFKTDLQSPTNKLSIRFFNDKVSQQSINLSRKSSRVKDAEDEDGNPNLIQNQLPQISLKKQASSLRKYVINNNANQLKLNESFSSSMSLEQPPAKNDEIQDLQSPNKSKLCEKLFERSMSQSDTRSRVSSSASNRSQGTKKIKVKDLQGQDFEEQSQTPKNHVEQQVYKKYPTFNIVKKLGVGDNFGEIALRNEKQRTATVVCKSNCKFAVISKEAFQRILGDFFKTQMEEKEQFIQNLQIFKGYSSAYLANILMNIKKKTYNFNDIIYEEGSTKQKFYFIKTGEVELSKKVVNENKSEIKYEGQHEFKSSERVVMAQKYANDWFGEVEIMQKVPRFTRARCVSAKVEVFYISALKFFANINIEEMITDLKKSSAMIDSWRQKHYGTMVHRIYNSKKDPLRKTFENMQVAHDLINQKFKTDFLKTNPQQIVMPNKVEETSLAAKILYFTTVKTYVSKISDVIGTISKSKKIKDEIKEEEDIKSTADLSSQKNLQNRSQSLPRYSQPYQSSQNILPQSSLTHKRENSYAISEQSSPIKLPKIQLNDVNDQKTKKMGKFLNELATNFYKSSVVGVGASSQSSLPSLNSPFQKKISNKVIQTDREKNSYSSQFSTPVHQKIKLEIKKKPNSHQISQHDLDEYSGRHSTISQIPQSNVSLNQIQVQKLDKSPQHDKEYLESLYENIVHSKQKIFLSFNQDMNKKILEEGLRKKNLQKHQSKQHNVDFTNLNSLYNKSTTNNTQISTQEDISEKEKTQKLRLFRKLKLDNILQYKYPNKNVLKRKENTSEQEAEQEGDQNNKNDKQEENASLKATVKCQSYQVIIPEVTPQNKMKRHKPKQLNKTSSTQASPASKSYIEQQIYQNLTPSHFQNK